jgi:HK97 family phage major capsid protein
MTLSSAGILEISELSSKAETLARGTPSDKAVASVLLGRIANIRSVGLSSDEMRGKYSEALSESLSTKLPEQRYRHALRQYMTGNGQELRDLLAGQQSITYTQPQSGYLVDIQFRDQVFEGLKQVCPLFDSSVVTLIQEPTFACQPKAIAGWDLTQITSQAVGEAGFFAPQATPSVGGALLSGWTHRVSLVQSLESDEDILDSGQKTSRAASIGFARGVGAAITNGTGKNFSQPQGVATAAPSSVVIWGSGNYNNGASVAPEEIAALYFSVNRVHRASPKCCWMVSDTGYQKLRNAYDYQNRPLLSMKDDDEVLLGKRILISPDLAAPGGSPAQYGTVLFGDFSHFIVRLSAISVQRSMQTGNTPGNFTLGEYLWSFRLRCDSFLFDPSNGTTPPIVSATIHP